MLIFTKIKKNYFLIEKVDLVLIANQNFYHYQDTMFALKMGANIILEKPISTNFKDTKKLADFAKKKKIKNFSCYAKKI